MRDSRDGTWLARWRDPGGVQRKKSFARKVDGQRWLDQMQAQRQEDDLASVASALILIWHRCATSGLVSESTRPLVTAASAG